MKCKCCNREQDLRFGFCFDCADAESIITEGVDMWDEEVTKEEGMSITLSKLKKILTIYGVVKIQGGNQ